MKEVLEKTKKLGFGLMRLPKKDDVIDVEQVKVLVDQFLEAGFTYFDTAWAYQGSEEAIRQALVERYPRDSFTLATKNAAWINCKTREDAIAQFETSLERTGAGYFDFYLLHNLGGPRTHFFEDYDMWSFVKEMKEAGKIRHYGFSFHSTPEELEEILTRHPDAEFVQLQINYADLENPAIQSRAVYEVARKHGKPVVIMEPAGERRTSGGTAPVRGGDLQKRGTGIQLCQLGRAVRRGSGRSPRGALRNEHRGTDDGQHQHPEGFQRPDGSTERDSGKSAESHGGSALDPVHHLQLLCQGMPHGDRHLRIFYRHEHHAPVQ